MPIYEYYCAACAHHMEAFQFVDEDPLLQCPKCNKMSLTKQISAAAFHLKGGGWYATDFKNPKPPETSPKETAAVNATESTAKEPVATKKAETSTDLIKKE